MLKNINKRMADDPRGDAWKPAAAKFVLCVGCGDKIGTKTSKGICNFCDVRNLVNKKLQ